MNVIVILLDTLRRDYLSPYGNTWMHTPSFERLAQMGTTFDQAYLTSYPCMPARRDILTGRFEFPWRGWGPLEPADHSLPATLSTAGVRTGLVTDHYHLFEHGAGNYHFTFDSWEFIRGQEKDAWRLAHGEVLWPAPEFEKVHRGWRQYWANTRRWRDGLDWRSETLTFAAQTFQRAADWVEENASTGPFFLFIDNFDPHEPFDPPPAYVERYAPAHTASRVIWPIYGRADRYTPDELEGIRSLYAGEVTLVDAWLGYLLDRLDRLGRLKDTMLIVTTDHGHLFGEHGMIGKPSTSHGDSNLYQEIASIPLFVYHPDIPGGSRRDDLAQLVDVYPTVLDAFGVPPPAGLHGYSLLPALRDPTASWPREFAYYAKYGEAINATDGRFTLFQWPAGESNAPLHWYSPLPPEFLRPRIGPYDACATRYPADWPRGPMRTALYDLAADPHQLHDLSSSDIGARVRLQRALRDWLVTIRAPAEQLERLDLTHVTPTDSGAR
ncbi:MAG: sulfatase [Chloroflexi bacterium]|nr:sulfatase [Chloroflexota bacterium]